MDKGILLCRLQSRQPISEVSGRLTLPPPSLSSAGFADRSVAFCIDLGASSWKKGRKEYVPMSLEGKQPHCKGFDLWDRIGPMTSSPSLPPSHSIR